MSQLKIIKAVYYDPALGPERGTDVTAQLSAEIRNNVLLYNGVYNRILPDHFKRIDKKLKVEIEYQGNKFTQFYNEDEKINLPHDLGMIKKNTLDYKNPWAVTIIGGVAVGIIILLITEFFN